MDSNGVHYEGDINKIVLMKLKKEELLIKPQAIEEKFLDLYFKIALKIDHMDPTVLKEISEDFEKNKCFCCSTDILKKRKILFCCDKLEV